MMRLAKPAVTSLALSLLFLVVYGGCNWITSLRSGVGSCCFAWERHIPFIPLMILPYMSIDLFYVTAPFLAGPGRQLRTLTWRITAAILIGAVCFLLFPLRLTFDRPSLAGALGLIFNDFRKADLPFNQFPCLHVTLCLILADFYFHHTRGWWRWLITAWFALIFLSPLPTHQHHIIDIFGGLGLAIVCFHFFRDQPLRRPFMPNRRVGGYYAVGAAALTAGAFAWRPFSAILFWPAFSLALVACGYVFLGPGIYRKENGRLTWTARLLLAPVLLGQRISLAWYSRRCAPYDRLTDHLWIGRRLSPAQARQARADGVTAIIDLTAEFTQTPIFRNAAYLQLPVLDLTAPTPRQIQQAVTFITRHATGNIVYLHCKIGYSRTATIAGAYLLASGQCHTVAQAIAALRQARPSIIIRSEALAALHAYELHKGGCLTKSSITDAELKL